MNGFGCCRRERLRRCFNINGGRLTIPRKIILEFFHKNKGHFTAEEIFERINENGMSVSLATIYRTLNSLWQSGILNRFDFYDGKSKYELSEQHHGQKHHHHLICRNCGKIIEYDDFIEEELKLFERLEKELSNKYDFKIDGHNLYFYGLCKNCKIR